MSQSFLIGVKTKIFFTVMPDELLALPEIVPPTDVTFTTDAAIDVGDDEVALSAALSKPVPAGTPISLTVGAGAAARTLTVFTSEHAKTGDEVLAVVPVTAKQIQRAMKDNAATQFPTAATGTYVAKLLLQGGTSAQKTIENQDTDTQMFASEGLSFRSGVITSANWNISYDFNVLPLDPGYYRLNWSTINGIGGAHGYVWFEDPAPQGYDTGNSVAGLCQSQNINQTNPADGIITGQSQLLGRGTPKFGSYA
jgi:hypothetical protein